MGSVNRWIGIGNLGADVELKYIANGKAVATLSLACNETWKDKSGQKQEKVEWVRVTVWAETAENCAKYLAKGRQVYVEGRLETRSYEKDGQKHYSTQVVADKVVFLGSGKGREQGDGERSSAPAGGGRSARGGTSQKQWPKDNDADDGDTGNGGKPPISDDDIPF